MRYTALRLVWFTLHFLLIFGIACHDALGLMARGYTLLPGALNHHWKKAQKITAAGIGLRLPRNGAVSQSVRAYLHGAGIESGYSYFAPSVPDSYQVVFELRRANGETDYETLGGDDAESSTRISSLLDRIGQTDSDELRQIMVQLLTHAVWQRHPDVTHIRTIFGTVTLPSVHEFRAGQKASSRFLYAYDFSLAEE